MRELANLHEIIENWNVSGSSKQQNIRSSSFRAGHSSPVYYSQIFLKMPSTARASPCHTQILWEQLQELQHLLTRDDPIGLNGQCLSLAQIVAVSRYGCQPLLDGLALPFITPLTFDGNIGISQLLLWMRKVLKVCAGAMSHFIQDFRLAKLYTVRSQSTAV
jgi:hypothetical protein